jgi:hypothetical protein
VKAIEIALRKQLLVLDAAAQREALARHANGLVPIFDVADQVNAGVHWVRRNPEAVAAGLALLVAVRPGVRRFFWRWGRRGFVAWRLWRDGGRWLQQQSPSL